MNVGMLLSKAAKTYPERLAIANGEYELTYQQDRLKCYGTTGKPCG
jgi:hypothetical protein